MYLSRHTWLAAQKLQLVFILWHISSSPARERKKVQPRGGSWQPKTERTADSCLLCILLWTPLHQRSFLQLSQWLQTRPSLPIVKSLYFQRVIWLIALTSLYYLPRPFNAVHRASIPKVIRCNRMPYWDFQAWACHWGKWHDDALFCHNTTATATETATE